MRLPNGQHLGYCTNVHPYDSVDGLLSVLAGPTASLRQRLVDSGRLGTDEPLGVGLWFPATVARELSADPALLRSRMEELQLYVFTVNAFPYGDFHGERVKDEVFRPGWDSERRIDYTLAAAAALAALLPEGLDGSISTHTGGYKPWGLDADQQAAIAAGFVRAARGLAEIEDRTGRRIVLAMEPEPLSLLETTDEVVTFFERHALLDDEATARHLGLCFDACHQAVEFEPMGTALETLAGAGIPIAKVQLSSAIRVGAPSVDRERLHPFAEDCWFHQVVARHADGALQKLADLPDALADERAAGAIEWRVHFHVPIFASDLDAEGRLSTTRRDLEALLALVADRWVTPHLEIETYSFGMIPAERRAAMGAVELVDGLEREFEWTLDLHPATGP